MKFIFLPFFVISVAFLFLLIFPEDGSCSPKSSQEEIEASRLSALHRSETEGKPGQIYAIRRKKNKNKSSSNSRESSVEMEVQPAISTPQIEWGVPSFRRTPIMVEGTSKQSSFKSNIPLPQNPFMPFTASRQAGETSNSKVFFRTSSGGSNSRADSSKVNNNPAQAPQTQTQTHYNKQQNNEKTKIHHAVRPNPQSQNQQIPQKTHQAKPPPPQYVPRPQQAPIRPRPQQVPIRPRPQQLATPFPTSKAQFANILQKLKHVEEVKASFPPPGAFAPFGERTVLLLRYPGLPERKRASLSSLSLGPLVGNMLKLGGIKPVTLSNDDFASAGKIKEGDVGVVISQNYVLKPEFAVNSPYSYNEGYDEEKGDTISELAKALAERNRVLAKLGEKPAPFALVHIESFTKRRNKTTQFGFDDFKETNYSNGTVIYPTLLDPQVLASTKFEFENYHQLQSLFDRPMVGNMQNGGMKPIIPLGLLDIQNLLKIMYNVHKEQHEAGRRKGEDKEDGSENANMRERWMHSSTIGIRTLSDFPPPPAKLPIPYPT